MAAAERAARTSEYFMLMDEMWEMLWKVDEGDGECKKCSETGIAYYIHLKALLLAGAHEEKRSYASPLAIAVFTFDMRSSVTQESFPTPEPIVLTRIKRRSQQKCTQVVNLQYPPPPKSGMKSGLAVPMERLPTSTLWEMPGAEGKHTTFASYYSM